MTVLRKAYGIAKLLHDEVPYRFFNGYAFRPLRVTFEVTYRCNLKCEMCYLVIEGREKQKDELTSEEIKNVISQLTRKIPLTFTGGEPLLKEGIMDVLKYASKRNVFGLLTNGILITENKAKELVEIETNSLTISIDGIKDIHDKIRGKGSFEKAMEGIKRIQEQKKKQSKSNPRININAVIMPSNIDTLHEIVELASDLSIDLCSFQALDPSLNRSGLNVHNDINRYMKTTINQVDHIDPVEMRRCLEKIDSVSKKNKVKVNFVPRINRNDLIDYYSRKIDAEKYICKFPWSALRISPFGDLYPCFNYSIGNIRKNKISELWNNDQYKNFRKSLKNQKIFPGCVGCCYLAYG